jgi:hypothetical protein
MSHRARIFAIANPLSLYVRGPLQAYLEQSVEPGTRLPTGGAMPGVVATPDGLLHVATRETKPASPEFVITH